MKTQCRNLGRGLTIFLEHHRYENFMHDEIDAWHAPSECHALASRGEDRRFRAMRRHVEGVTGLKWKVFREQVIRRTGLRWLQARYGVSL